MPSFLHWAQGKVHIHKAGRDWYFDIVGLLCLFINVQSRERKKKGHLDCYAWDVNGIEKLWPETCL